MASHFQVQKTYTTLQFVREYIKLWIVNRFKEGSTYIGFVAFLITLANDPQVFQSLSALYNAAHSKQGAAAVTAAVVSLALIVIRQRKGYDEKWQAHVNLSATTK